ncbi:DNA methyltransferase [Streptococcus equinus ATCC 33317]|uniref:DNA methyltransferase n=1 Tax=Streptococcus equinus TaxID=1335 RepID=UPI000507AE27|nr:DNA methyltransferase [Streptococcus equinus]KFN86906.1 DNA methyltransferase [Streptococcus equinus ATCC 33317]
MAKLDIVSIEDKTKELLENLNESGFFYDFLGLYDFPKATLTRLRKNNGNEVKNKALFEVIGQGQSVVAKVAEMEKALSSKKSKPRILIATDFEELAAKDIQTADTLNISLKDLPAYVDFFLPWNGVEKVDYAKENPADIKAAARFTRLYDELRQINQFDDQTTEEKEFNLFLIRLLFLLFAEDTEIMPKGIFTNAIKTRSAEDGSDLDNLINKIFASLDVANRSSQEKWLQEFPYVNGKLFTKAHTALVFDRKTRKLIIEAGELLNWNEINPDILGAMIQTVASKEQRSVSGMHYTSVENIMKVIKPLFLDDLTVSYQNLVDKINENEDKDITDKTRRENRNTFIRELESLLDRISNIKFLDPACGSGNFLIITYKEIRRLEVKILKSLRELRQDGTIDFFETSKISLNQFYGIELDDFAHEVARLSLWIAEYQMNLEAENEINLKSAFLPLRDAGNITQGNALRLDWNEILPHQSDDEIYLIGNPPYIGASLQSKIQKDDIKLATQEATKYGKMDYIAGWFFKGAAFINSANSKLAFVTTNSIFQGEQVSIIWKSLIKNTVIDFAYTSFKWGNSAANNAGVTVAIVGLSNIINTSKNKQLFDENNNRVVVSNINPYLTNGENILIQSSRTSLAGLPKMSRGNGAYDGGGLIFEKSDYQCAVEEYPDLVSLFYKYINGQDFIRGEYRYALFMNNDTYTRFKDNPIIKQRIEKVKLYRLSSKSKPTQLLAEMPWRFGETKDFSGQAILIPRVSSEGREYVPMDFLDDSKTIVSDAVIIIENAPIWLLGLLESRMHMVWLRAVGGRLKTDYRYSAGLVYNTFPVPELSTRRKNMIEEQVFEILDLREELGGTLAELYHKDTMPESLREAHKKLDEIVERAYKDTPFNSDEERLSHLLKRYKEMTHE